MAYQQDPPNWPQLSSYQTSGVGGGGSAINQNNLNLLQPQIPSNTSGSIRPPAGLTSDHRARLTKLLPQQADQHLLALNCPRCDSTNTKFCYFNNYSLTQPRHFCKTCRRYWTRGGALRNVPVGGGCRRNKRSKGSTSNTTTSSSSKSPVNNTIGSASTTSTTSISTSNMLGHFVPPPQQVQSSFYPSLRNLSSFGTTRDSMHLNFGSGGGSEASGGPIFPTGLRHEMLQQFQFSSSQMQHFNFSSGGILDQQPSGLYQQYDQIIQGEGVDQLLGYIEGTGQMIRSITKQPLLDFGVAGTNLDSMKSEESQELNLSRNFMGVQGNNAQYWGDANVNANANANSSTNAWSDLSSFTSSFSKP